MDAKEELLKRRAEFSAAKRALLEKRLRGEGAGSAPARQVITPRRERYPAPLSFAQQRLWFIEQLQPGSATFNMHAPVRLRGPLDVAALEKTLSEILRRHEALRTGIEIVGEQPVQVLSTKSDFALPVEDLTGLAEAEREAEARRLMGVEERTPFDLTRGALLRARLLKLGEREHVLMLTMHHIAGDHASMGILFKEFAALYGAFAAGRSSSPLAELPIQYADYAHWQEEWLRTPALERSLAYWRERLGGELPTLELPLYQQRPELYSLRGGHRTARLPADLVASVKELSQRQGVTLFMSMLAAFKVLLHRYTGGRDIIVGTSVGGRNYPECEPLIGVFLNMVALRTDLSGDPTFAELLARTQEVTSGAYAHQEVPFEKLIDDFQTVRDLSRTPIFQVTFNLLYQDAGNITLPDIEIEPLEFTESGAKFDLSMYVTEQREQMRLKLVYNPDVIAAETVRLMLVHYEAVLREATREPHKRLSAFSLAGEGQTEGRESSPREQRPRPAAPFVEFTRAEIEQTIPARFARQVALFPERVAVKTEAEEWSYAQLNVEADAMAHHLLTRRPAQADGEAPPVALLFEHGAQMVAAILGTLKAGRAYVPLDVSLPPERLAFVLRDARAGQILTNGANLERALSIAAAVRSQDEPEVIDADRRVRGATPADVATRPDALAYVLYTSGSTARPKGVMQTHRNVLHHIRAYTNCLHIGADDRLTLFSSYTFDAAVMDIFGALLNGAALFPVDLHAQTPEAVAAWMRAQEVSIYHSTPTVFRYLVNNLRGGRQFPTLRVLALGGEEATRNDFELYRGVCSDECLMLNGMGPTESTFTLHYFLDRRTTLTRPSVPVGHPVTDTEVRLLNEAGEQLAVYGTGEMVIRSEHVAVGYLQQPELTAAAFRRDADGGARRAYFTGDIGRRLPDGGIEFVGRKDSQIKIRGYRVELGEVEAKLLEADGIREAVVEACAPVEGNRFLTAYVVPEQGRAPSAGALRKMLGEALPSYMVPASYVFLDSLPRTAHGKLDRRALPAPAPISADGGDEFMTARTPSEDILAGIWARVLKLERVGIHDNFFEIGGHSLLAVQVVARVRDAFNVDVPLGGLFQQPTVARLAAKIDERIRAGHGLRPVSIEPVAREDGEAPVSFEQQRLWFLNQLEPDSGVYNMPLVVRLTGRLSHPALGQCVNELVRRHETLRTSFQNRAGVPVQRIHEPEDFDLTVTRLQGADAAEKEQEARRLAEEEARKPFDLSRAPLFRARLLQLGEDEHVLLFTIHHIISDAWSVATLFSEVAALYAAYREGEPSPLKSLPIQYADYAHWQRARVEGGELEKHLAYWRRQLADAPPVIELPTDRPHPAAPALRGAAVKFSLPQTLMREVQTLGRQEGCTLFMTLLTAFKSVLYGYARQSDIVVGTPVSNRPGPELESLIGCFVNTLALRTGFGGNPSFKTLLRRVRGVCLEAYAHQEAPFERVVAELKTKRAPNRTPLFQTMFVLQNTPSETIFLPELRLDVLNVETGTAKFDLLLSITPQADEKFTGFLSYRTDLFDRATIEQMSERLQECLREIVEAPQRRIADMRSGAPPKTLPRPA